MKGKMLAIAKKMYKKFGEGILYHNKIMMN